MEIPLACRDVISFRSSSGGSKPTGARRIVGVGVGVGVGIGIVAPSFSITIPMHVVEELLSVSGMRGRLLMCYYILD